MTATGVAVNRVVRPVDGMFALERDDTPRDHSFDSAHVLLNMTGKVGPTALCAARLLRHLTETGLTSVSLTVLAGALGIQTAKALNTLERLVRFGWLSAPGEGRLVVPTGVNGHRTTTEAVTA